MSENRKIYFAYDMSLHGDWVSRYAIRLASNFKIDLQLLTVSNKENKIQKSAWDARITQIRRESERSSVHFFADLIESQDSVSEAIESIVSAENGTEIVCGTRPHSKRKGIFSGSVAEKLSKKDSFSVSSFRVVGPGILGNPSDILIPAIQKKVLAGEIEFLSNYFQGEKIRLHLLRVVSMHPFLFSHATDSAMERKRKVERESLSLIIKQLKEKNIKIYDSYVSISKNKIREIRIQANKTRSRLILLPFYRQGLLNRILTGNEIERILQGAPCDVAIIKHRSNE